jgi:hypothetical protein
LNYNNNASVLLDFSDVTEEQTDANKSSGLTYVLLTVPIPLKNKPNEFIKILGAGKNKQSAKLGAAKYHAMTRNTMTRSQAVA